MPCNVVGENNRIMSLNFNIAPPKKKPFQRNVLCDAGVFGGLLEQAF